MSGLLTGAVLFFLLGYGAIIVFIAALIYACLKVTGRI